jgi:hypothetical protein
LGGNAQGLPAAPADPPVEMLPVPPLEEAPRVSALFPSRTDVRGNAYFVAQIGRVLLVFGALLLLVGCGLIIAEKLGLGRLPGDIVVEKKGFRLYAPLATSIIVSLVLTALLNLFMRK